MDGKPVVRGTRVSVELVLHKLRADTSAEAILVDHPQLTHDDIDAAQAFEARRRVHSVARCAACV
jgi:uncharacterized protein (DUF433 family)